MNQTERTQILQKVEQGKISVQDAVGMMSPTAQPVTSAEPVDEPTDKPIDKPVDVDIDASRWLHIRVTNLETGQGKVNVSLPLGWMKFGLAMGSRFVPQMGEIDIEEVMQALDQSATDQLVQVEDLEGNERVEIFIA